MAGSKLYVKLAFQNHQYDHALIQKDTEHFLLFFLSLSLSLLSMCTDSLVDCMDPDCCLQSSCQASPFCRGSPDPRGLVGDQQSPAPQSFYQRVSFLVGPGGSHTLPGDNPFNSRYTLNRKSTPRQYGSALLHCGRISCGGGR